MKVAKGIHNTKISHNSADCSMPVVVHILKYIYIYICIHVCVHSLLDTSVATTARYQSILGGFSVLRLV